MLCEKSLPQNLVNWIGYSFCTFIFHQTHQPILSFLDTAVILLPNLKSLLLNEPSLSPNLDRGHACIEVELGSRGLSLHSAAGNGNEMKALEFYVALHLSVASRDRCLDTVG